jgi:hypothetical protein
MVKNRRRQSKRRRANKPEIERIQAAILTAIIRDIKSGAPSSQCHHRTPERSGLVTLDEVYDAIGQFPEGLTSKQIADFLGKSAIQVSSLASKLFFITGRSIGISRLVTEGSTDTD